MSLRRAQGLIAGIFLAGLLCNCVAVLLTYARGSIFADDLRAMLQLLLAEYSAPLAIVIAGIFGQAPAEKRRLAGTFWFAIAVSIVWNLFLLWGASALLISSLGSEAKEGAVDDFSSYVRTISSSATFLVSGALTYFFVKRA